MIRFGNLPVIACNIQQETGTLLKKYGKIDPWSFFYLYYFATEFASHITCTIRKFEHQKYIFLAYLHVLQWMLELNRGMKAYVWVCVFSFSQGLFK
jgi:hypothetical protein